MLKKRAIAQKFGSLMFAGLMVLTAGVATAAPASAATACNTWGAERVVAGQTEFRAGALCTEIDSNARVRLVVVREPFPNHHSPWLTEDTAYSTGWLTCPSGCDAFLQVRTS